MFKFNHHLILTFTCVIALSLFLSGCGGGGSSLSRDTEVSDPLSEIPMGIDLPGYVLKTKHVSISSIGGTISARITDDSFVGGTVGDLSYLLTTGEPNFNFASLTLQETEEPISLSTFYNAPYQPFITGIRIDVASAGLQNLEYDFISRPLSFRHDDDSFDVITVHGTEVSRWEAPILEAFHYNKEVTLQVNLTNLLAGDYQADIAFELVAEIDEDIAKTEIVKKLGSLTSVVTPLNFPDFSALPVTVGTDALGRDYETFTSIPNPSSPDTFQKYTITTLTDGLLYQYLKSDDGVITSDSEFTQGTEGLDTIITGDASLTHRGISVSMTDLTLTKNDTSGTLTMALTADFYGVTLQVSVPETTLDLSTSATLSTDILDTEAITVGQLSVSLETLGLLFSAL